MGQSSGIDLSVTGTVPLYKIGQLYVDPNGVEWRYVKGAATIAQYETCAISKDGNYTCVLLDTDTTGHGAGKSQSLGVPQISAGLTSTTYAWVFVGCGPLTIKVLANCAADASLYATSTGGALDDTSTTTLIPGLSIITVNGGSTATAAAWATGRLMTAGI